MRPTIAVVGSLNADVVLRVRQLPQPGETITAMGRSVFPGGKGANQAFGSGRLGAHVVMVGQVGNDMYAGWLRDSLATAGVNTSHIASDPTVNSGSATIAVDDRGQNHIIVDGGANATFTPAKLEASRVVLEQSRVVLLQLEIPEETVIAAAEIARSVGAIVILDPAPARPLSSRVLELVDYVTPNETELATLTDAPRGQALSDEDVDKRARLLREMGAKNVVVKLGGRGARLFGPSGTITKTAREVSVVDTTAAGDSFNAGFGYALARGDNEERALDVAVAAGSYSVTRAGAQPSMPTLSEVEWFLGFS